MAVPVQLLATGTAGASPTINFVLTGSASTGAASTTLSGEAFLDASVTPTAGSHIVSVDYDLLPSQPLCPPPPGNPCSDTLIAQGTPTLYGWLAGWDTTQTDNGTYQLEVSVEDVDASGTMYSDSSYGPISITVAEPRPDDLGAHTVERGHRVGFAAPRRPRRLQQRAGRLRGDWPRPCALSAHRPICGTGGDHALPLWIPHRVEHREHPRRDLHPAEQRRLLHRCRLGHESTHHDHGGQPNADDIVLIRVEPDDAIRGGRTPGRRRVAECRSRHLRAERWDFQRQGRRDSHPDDLRLAGPMGHDDGTDGTYSLQSVASYPPPNGADSGTSSPVTISVAN